jgi:DNA polymerase-3 subunit gamma/tau
VAVSDLAENPAGETFQSLYRRFRPQRFDEVRGQDHVTLALRNAVRESRVAHAYLFSGPRGTGKTSTARILGKALNCTALVDGQPCGVCDSCRSIASGNSFDVHELDAASNNGVDAMRDLVARSSLATPGRWKVYIVDEVHMLSTAASNALLKTLEEPPDHVVFVLATTDPQKVLPTIRSRTQQYEFHLMADDVLAGLVEDVATSAGLTLPTGAASQAVRKGRGSARDTLSILDQVAAAGVIDDDADDLAKVIAAIAQEDGRVALTALDRAVRHGRDPQQIAVDLVELLRSGFLSLAGATSVAEGIAWISADDLEILRSLGLARCVRGMELIGNAIVSMRDAAEPRITLEIAVLRAVSLDQDSSVEALLERIARLERKVEALGSGTAAPSATPAPPPPSRPRAHDPVENLTKDVPDGAATEITPLAVAPTPSGRPALGAFRSQSAAAPPAAAPPTASVDPQPIEPLPVEAAPTRPDPVAPGPTAVSSPSKPAPDRDAFVLAWGDAVLTGLRPRTRMLYNVGRFVSAQNGVGVFALPNAFHVEMAAPHCDEVAAAMSAHLGAVVTIELVVEKRSGPDEQGGREVAVSSANGATPEDPAVTSAEDDVNFDDVGDPIEDEAGALSAGAEWATDRLRAAFPGAEEVSP